MLRRATPLSLLSLLASCCPAPTATSPDTQTPAGPIARVEPAERHFGALRQLTFGGENAEAYWSFDGTQLVFQATPPGAGCDQIFRMNASAPGPHTRVSSGDGATTCAYFLPGDDDIIYASTHLGGASCPEKPDRSQGYVWPLYASYDIFRSRQDGSQPTRLTKTPGYDAEATVCKKDGSIVFTSVRDGDLEIYRMNADGSDQQRLTHTVGYDGGAFFNDDCSKIVWRASRPEGKARDDYQRLLKENLVRPTKLEIWVANADGSDARQVTYLGAASFAPFWFPTRERIIFSSNHHDPKGREFDLWAINADGSELEQISHAAGFDGFPMFSPDGKWLAFSSNRATLPGQHDTNVFVTRWVDPPAEAELSGHRNQPERPADRVKADVSWLAAPARQGRGLGSDGLAQAGQFIAERFAKLGLKPGLGHSYLQPFDVPIAITVGAETALTIDNKPSPLRLLPHPASASGLASGKLVSAGYGIVSAEHAIDDYAGKDVRGKVVLVRRFVPAGKISDPNDEQRLSSISHKAWLARERGAVALLVADMPETAATTGTSQPDTTPADAPFAPLNVDGYGDSGIPVMQLERALGQQLLQALRRRPPTVVVKIVLERRMTQTANVVALLPATTPAALPGALVIGAHYDHLGRGGRGSLAPDSQDYHLGADDNASGVAALLEAARQLTSVPERQRDIWLVAFSAEESGVIGSSYFVNHPPAASSDSTPFFAMLNMDMVGRVRDNTLVAFGGETASEWPALVAHGCDAAGLACISQGDGYGPSDHMPFYSAGVSVLHFFSGAHSDYHKPSDRAERVNAAGAAQTAKAVTTIAQTLVARAEPLHFQRSVGPAPAGDRRSWGASLGTVPDYADQAKAPGMRIADVRLGGAAELAGLRAGDRLLKLSTHSINSVRDLMYALGSLKPDQTVQAVVQRGSKQLTLQVTLQKSAQRHR